MSAQQSTASIPAGVAAMYCCTRRKLNITLVGEQSNSRNAPTRTFMHGINSARRNVFHVMVGIGHGEELQVCCSFE
jgi:hypothetical protein